jgi:hypothetical protein
MTDRERDRVMPQDFDLFCRQHYPAVYRAALPFERLRRAERYGTIFVTGSSIMSSAPSAFSFGISVLIADFDTIVSTAK